MTTNGPDAMDGDTASTDLAETSVPWSARSPQRWIFAIAAVALTVAIVIAALGSIRTGEGSVVPFLMLLVGPVLGGFYFWYFSIKRW